MKRIMLLLAFFAIGLPVLLAQTKQITGKVTSADDGSAIPGVSVAVKGTTLGTITNAEGTFTLKMPDSATTLVLSFVGMQTEEVYLTSSTSYNVKMKSDVVGVDEVMVVAYGTAKKSSLTGAISQVSSEKIERSIGTSVTGALEGAAPGVQVNNTYGEPGSSPIIRIRGFGSVNGSNAPLYVVDGVPFDGNISDINSNDIESLTVLKDAASSALYGNRAANGVILITTKRAKNETKPTVTLTTNHGAYTRGMKEYDRLGADSWMEAQWTGMKHYAMSLSSLKKSESDAASYATSHLIGDLVKRNIYDAADDKLFDSNGKLTAKILPGYTDLDWADELEKTGYRQDYGISYAANSDKSNIFASFGYLNEDGYIINTGFERYSTRINSAFTPTKWFKGGINVAGTSQNQNYNSSAYSTYYANPFNASRTMAPVYPIYLHNEDGSYLLDANGNKEYDTKSDYLSNRHIIYERLTNDEKNARLTLDANIFGTIVLPYGFDLTVRGAKSLTSLRRSKFDNPEIGDGAANNGRLSNYDYRFSTTNFQQQLNWTQQYDQHHIDVLLAHESYQYESSVVYGMNTSMSVTGNVTMGNFTTNSYYMGNDDKDATESYLGRARYNYNEKYYFETSFRRDGSSRFSKDNRWGNFFSFGGAWDITKESFMKNISWVDFAKLRASYGEVGNNYVATGSDVNYYAYQALYYLDKNAGSGALLKQSLSATDVKWETTQTLDIALEANLLKRLNVQIGWFDKRSKDLLFAVPLPSSAGGYIWNASGDYNLTQLKNIGTVSNRGIEFSATVDIIKNSDWRWDFGLDATILKNEIKTLPDGKDIANGTTKRYSEGHSIYEFYTYHYEGVDQMTGNALYTIDPEQAATATTNGKLVNINGTDYTTDVTYGLKGWAGSALPDVYGSIHTGASWKGWSLNVLATYSLGGKVFDSGYQDLMTTSASSAEALHKDVLKSWNGIPNGMTATSTNRIDRGGIPILDHNLTTYTNATSDRWLVSASYFVLKNVTLAYELP